MTTTMTLSQLMIAVRQRADMVPSSSYTPSTTATNIFVTDPELISYINQSYFELYDLLVAAFGNDYFVATPYQFTTDGTSDAYALPSDFYKLLGVDLSLAGGTEGSWLTVRSFEFNDRNRYSVPNFQAFYGVTNLRYRLMGTDLTLVPIASAGQTVRIWYVPRPSQLVSDTDIVDGISGWEEYVIVDACIKALTKEETECQNFKEQKMALLARIDGIKNTRDVGEPEKVSDSKLRNFAWGDDGSFGGGNGGMW